jgi:cellulose synthase/poly-beta-1,6-N-acetylglucosamine synthase-like glycosyltransferase
MDLSGDLPGYFPEERDASRAGSKASEEDGSSEPDYGTRLSEIFFPVLAEWRPVLARLSVPPQAAFEAAARAQANGGDFAAALLACGMVRGGDLLAAVAADLDLPVAGTIDPARLIVSDEHAASLLRDRSRHVPVKLMENDGGISFLITPQRIPLGLLRGRLRASSSLAARMKMADATELRQAVLRRIRPALARAATTGLFERFPQLSARIVANAWQGTVFGVALTALTVGLVFAPTQVLAVLHGCATFFFFACTALRFAAVASLAPWRRMEKVAPPADDAPLFSVLVALYREANMVPGLLAALERLAWPRDQLEIKLVCEADDAATLAAIRAHPLPRHIEIVEVPPGLPRTKPKALAYALPLTGGEFVTLYDAEDRPDPMQLAEAWQRFRQSGPDLAVLQAPLEISNRSDGAIARMFAFEYAALFRGLLPWLSRRRLMLPLGGTSNHFRRAALDAVGGWDPYNVTEDADLGIRLARFGYHAATISRPTFEPAPTRLGVWMPQRTRWFKGWAQTWLVHMREPRRLLAQLGPASFLVAQVLFAGMLASAVLHPVLLGTVVLLLIDLFRAGATGQTRSALLMFDIANIACGYLSFLLLGWQTLTAREKLGFWKVVLLTPPYWVLLSLAGWRAIWQLRRRPHLWEKTPHDAPRPRSIIRAAGPARR